MVLQIYVDLDKAQVVEAPNSTVVPLPDYLHRKV